MSAMPGVVAINTFREAVRDRVLYNLVFFALLMIGAAILVGQISIGIDRLVIINLGLIGDFRFWTGDGGIHRRGARLQGNREAHALQPSCKADPALAIPGGKVCGVAADACGQHRADDGWAWRPRFTTWAGRSCARTPRF